MIRASRLAATGMAVTCPIAMFVLPTATACYSVSVVFVPLFAWGLANFGDDVVDLVGIPGGRTSDISIRGVGLLVRIALSRAVLCLSALDALGIHERAGLTA
jgi:hypothetical protein